MRRRVPIFLKRGSAVWGAVYGRSSLEVELFADIRVCMLKLLF